MRKLEYRTLPSNQVVRDVDSSVNNPSPGAVEAGCGNLNDLGPVREFCQSPYGDSNIFMDRDLGASDVNDRGQRDCGSHTSLYCSEMNSELREAAVIAATYGALRDGET